MNMSFEFDRLHIYNKGVHKSKIKSYKQNNLATMNAVNKIISFQLLERKIINKSILEIEFQMTLVPYQLMVIRLG